MVDFHQLLRLLDERFEFVDDLGLALAAFIPEYLEVVLDQFATFCDVLCCLHLVSGQHPHFDVRSN